MRESLTILILCLLFFGVSCCRQNAETQVPVFPVATTECLKQSDFSTFLGPSNVVFRTDNLGGSIFKSAPRYLGGATLRSEHRGIGLAVFESHEAALAAVEFRRANVAAVITPGAREQNGIDTWWFSEDQALLSIVHGNAILEVNDIRKRYSEIEDELWRTASELIKAAEQSLARIQQ